MSAQVTDAHGSAMTAEPNLHSRLVMASPTFPEANNTDDAGALFSSVETDHQSVLPSKKQLPVDPEVSSALTDSDDGRIATEDEVRDLLHVVDQVPVRLWISCLAGILERFVWYGATAPLQNYLQNSPGGEVPGALGLGEATASNIINALTIVSYLVPVPAAIVTDSWLGRYKTMLYSAIIEALGATLLFATSIPAAIHSGAALGGMVSGCALLAVGSGSFKTAVVPFIADQYEETEFRIRTRKTGEKVVSSRELTITYIYNTYYFAVNVACFIADCTPLLERYVDFWLAYLIPCCMMWLALAPVLLGRSYYIRSSPTNNIMPQVAAALREGVAGGFKMDAARPEVQLAKHGRQVPWNDSFIEDIQRSLLTCRVLLLFPIHWLCFNQTFNNLISQAGQMKTYGIPNDMMKITGALAGAIVTPIIQNGLYPFLTRHRIRFGPIARMSVGFLVLTGSMVYTTVVQKLIYSTGPCYDRPLACPAAHDRTIPNQISAFLQVPIYFLGALAEVFCMTTGTEYAYSRAPDSMKTLVQAIWLATAGIGSCLALAFTPLTKDPQLVTMYALLTGLLGGSTVLLWVLFRHLDKIKEENRNEAGSN
ncbi:hypothetical protein BO71DRAFT_412496 [Aspergillus ellipticus CBS 707.79]|uniref:Oligopeptide transporter n=1 Tax=Aspergillus ellipticus CBS 707.79 TaxID=1448320 RepID=A0A319D011_9EURO|nr:hypothetical protein BO71DRAFT_412496 [Aspergillus ellipticus CBS 707.79]